MSLGGPVVRDSMSQALDKVSRLVSGFSILLSVAIIVCGILAILLPVEMSLGVVIVIAWLLMISGVVQVIYAISGITTGSRLWAGIIGVIYFSMGLFLRLNLGIGIAAFTLALICFVVQGVLDVFAYFRMRKAGQSGWQLIEGVVTLILGL